MLAHINTSYVERSNLTIRMGVLRLTRLTNAFSKKLENRVHHLALMLTLLQLLPHPQDAAGAPGAGGRRHERGAGRGLDRGTGGEAGSEAGSAGTVQEAEGARA